MERLDAFRAILYSSNPLLSLSGCSTTLRRSLNGLFLQLLELKEFSSPVPVCTLTQCPLGRVSSHRTFNSSVPSCAPMHLLNAHLAELSESSVILVLLSGLTAEFLPMHHYTYAQCPLGRASQDSQQSLCLLCTPCTCSMPSWQSFTELTQRFCLQLCFLIHSLASKVFNNLEVFLLS
jgi:hypothetical protein